MAFFRQVLAITAKDLRAELRTKEAINASLCLRAGDPAAVQLRLRSRAQETTREISGGLLWIVFAFAGTLVLNRSFARELPNDCLDALIAAPISGAALFLGKALANFRSGAGGGAGLRCRCSASSTMSLDAQFWQLMLVLAPGHLGADRDRHHLQRADGEHPAARR